MPRLRARTGRANCDQRRPQRSTYNTYSGKPKTRRADGTAGKKRRSQLAEALDYSGRRAGRNRACERGTGVPSLATPAIDKRACVNLSAASGRALDVGARERRRAGPSCARSRTYQRNARANTGHHRRGRCQRPTGQRLR